jgi:Bacterial regulatory proteins, luxR family
MRFSAKLNISVRTVESYRAEVMEKMRAESVAALVRQAIRLGCITRRTTTRSIRIRVSVEAPILAPENALCPRQGLRRVAAIRSAGHR